MIGGRKDFSIEIGLNVQDMLISECEEKVENRNHEERKSN